MTEKRAAQDQRTPAHPAPEEEGGVAEAEEQVAPAPGRLTPEGGHEAEEAGEVVKQDLDELTAAQRERDEYLELAQRTRADFDNYRKRVAKETSEALARGRAGLARDLIPVVDNLERALRSAGVDPDVADGAPADSPGADSPDGKAPGADALARGVALVLRELRSALQGAGVEAYDPSGEHFDPSWHEALSTRPVEGAEPGTVVETLERGYRLDGQVLRPARVVVSE